MKKILFCLISFFLACQTLSAQKDTEHWIAPYFDSSWRSYQHAVYLSTDSVTPVTVNIYNNNILLTTVTISKGNPQIYRVDSNLISENTENQAFRVISKGLYLKADKPFYCSLRIAEDFDSEIITSKGRAGIGTLFYVAASPNYNQNYYNFTAGILATEDSTTVTVSWSDPAVTFFGGTATGTSHTFTLNKGQSFLFSQIGLNPANLSGFIGAKVVADKPVTITNGSCYGNFTNVPFSGSVILDQSVPTSKLGNTFAMVKTLSTNPSHNKEGGLIIATEDHTEIYLNGATTPVATINAGQWYRINETSYITQPGGNNHANMYISTSKNVYLYQFIGVGSSGFGGGFNYIPPLNCLLPTKIDEIGKVNEMPGITVPITLKLNILTEAGANVLINGVPPTTAEGPYPLSGTTQWVTYAKEGVTGNLTITSTKAMTAGINGGYLKTGYGSYFAGFPSPPAITKTSGECIPDIVLEVQNEYDTYQWYRDGILIPGATNHTHIPMQAGNYTVKITRGCSVTTEPFEILSCTTETTINATICDRTKLITTAFTGTPRTVAPASVTIITPPTQGNATVDPSTGVITYVSNSGYTGNDRLVYKFCDITNTYCEQVTLNLTVSENPVVYDTTLRTCFLESNTATGLFNLTSANVTAATGITKKYYPSPTDAQLQTNEILTPDNYIAPNGVAFVRISNSNGCYSIAQIILFVISPKTSDILKDQIICIENTTTLDAGPGFEGYEWSTGATTPSISNVGVGTYWVRLRNGECVTRQTVKVYASENPVVTHIEISGTTATIHVVGGTSPYRYSIDGIQWQESNSFNNIPRGSATIYVKDSYNCESVEIQITVANLINSITPNGDGINDVLDYSALAGKSGLEFNIYDRYGSKIFQGNKSNGYQWNGTINNTTKVQTGTYWYEIGWTEPGHQQTAIKYTGWILVKNLE